MNDLVTKYEKRSPMYGKVNQQKMQLEFLDRPINMPAAEARKYLKAK